MRNRDRTKLKMRTGLSLNCYLLSLVLIWNFSSVTGQDKGLLGVAWEVHNGEYDKALEKIDALGINSKGVSWYKSLSHIGLQQLDLAKAYWEKSSAEHGEYHFVGARIYAGLGDLDNCLNQLDKYFEKNALADYHQVQNHFSFTKWNSNRSWIRFWANLQYHPHIDFLLAATKELKSDYPDLSLFDQLPNGFSETNYGQLLFIEKDIIEGRDGKAKRALAELADRDLSVMELIHGAEIWDRLEEAEVSASWYEKALQIDPLKIEVRKNYLKQLQKSQQNSKLKNEVAHIIRLGINDSEVLNLQAALLKESNSLVTLAIMNELIQEKPLDQSLWNQRAEIYLKDNNTQQALYNWTQSLDINPKQPDVYFQRAELRFSLQDQDGACHDWKKAFRLGHRKALDLIYKYCD